MENENPKLNTTAIDIKLDDPETVNLEAKAIAYAKAGKVLDLTIKKMCEHEMDKPRYDENVYEGSIEFVLEAIIQGFRQGVLESNRKMSVNWNKHINDLESQLRSHNEIDHIYIQVHKGRADVKYEWRGPTLPLPNGNFYYMEDGEIVKTPCQGLLGECDSKECVDQKVKDSYPVEIHSKLNISYLEGVMKDEINRCLIW